MEFNVLFDGAEDRFHAGLEELTRGVAALAQNSSRPHKQLIQRGNFVYGTGNVFYTQATLGSYSSILSETENAITLSSKAVPTWQDNEPVLERPQLEITAKVFTKPTSATLTDDIKQVVARVLAENRTTCIDTLIVAAPETQAADFDALVDAWSAAESLVSSGIVGKLGVSNVDAERLRSLLSTAKVKPSLVQVHTSASPVTTLARESGIAVTMDPDFEISLTNSQKRFGAAFNSALVPPFSQTSFSPLAIARYTAFLPERAIVVAKGYALKTKYTIA
jgi:hypothetical protein